MGKYTNIPSEIAAKLDASVSRVRRILFFRGVCATLAVLVASILAIMAIDAMVTIYMSWIRWLMWACAVAGSCAVAWFALVKPMRRRFTAAEIAALIERNHPELEERLSTVVELAQSGDTAASSRLMAELTKDAVKDVGGVSPRKEFTGRTVKPRLLAAAIAIGVLALLFAVFPKATLRLVTRAVMPAAEVDNIYASSLKVSPGDQTLLEGSSLTVNLAVDGGFPSRAFVRTRSEGKRELVERMVRQSEEGAAGPVFYSFNYPQVTKSFTYRMSCGSALTRAYTINVVPEPTYSDRLIELVHPAYTSRESERYTNTASIVGLAGSRVKVSAMPARAGISGEARLPGDTVVPAAVSADGRLHFDFDLVDGLQGGWSTVVWDANGFTNQVDVGSISIVGDTPPEVKLVSPENYDLKLPRTGSLPLEFEAKDDFGISRAILEACVGAGAWEEAKPLSVEKTDSSFVWLGSGMVQFLSPAYKGAGVIRFRVKVEDSLPAELGGPAVAYTQEIMVSIAGQGGVSLGRQSLKAQADAARKDIANIMDCLRRAKKDFSNARGNYREAENNNWRRNEAIRASENAKASVQNAEGLLADFIESLLDSRLETGAEIFRPVLDKHVTPVRQGAEDVLLLSRWNEKSEASLVLANDTDAAIKALEEAQRKFAILTKAAEDLQRLEDLAEREKALAEMAEKGEIEAKELAEEEKKLADELKNELKDEMEKSLDKQIEKAKELQEKGDDLEKRQQEIEKKAAEAAKNGDKDALKEAGREEEQLAKDIANLAKEAAKLADEIEQKAGTSEMDPSKTAESAEKASDLANEAAEKAKNASEKMKEGEAEGTKENMEGVRDALSEAQKQLESAQEKMAEKNKEFGENAESMNEMLNSMNEAIEAAQSAAEAQERAESESSSGERQNGEQQQGEQQQGQQQNGERQNGEQQQGEQQQGQQQNGERQNGEQQQGEQQQGQQQQGQQQQGQQQNGERQNGEQQQGEQQQGQQQQGQQQQGQQQQNGEQQQGQQQQGEQQQGQQQNGEQQQQGQQQQNGEQQQQNGAKNEAMQNAGKKARDAAEKMKNQANEQAKQNNMPMDQFEGEPSDEESSEEGPHQEGGKASKNSKHSNTPEKPAKKKKKSKKPESVQFADGDEENDWFKMKSESGAGAEVDSLDDVPAEYRGLVRDYFNALNEGGKKK